ncbi:hypothetical protein VCUG_00413 [Vavraia culicis subsp. floridensis]|uniref:Protein kish n=1 Tax=Vavraia culicis (isolate floridensis) TaxID=948595 RepID=L2GYJ8_VAVCU|nr:uncharacterized protein VCUG_00413 [Vavraia culicis subsp. floridensis]ELA48175.1 hypothetical protein VCUG_00413 [Vavraia culicis subsp. floridensis]
MSAFFNFTSLIRLTVLSICTITYIKRHFPSLIGRSNKGMSSIFYKATVIGERLSPYVALMCLFFAVEMFLSFFY